jgi:hypothetical protein
VLNTGAGLAGLACLLSSAPLTMGINIAATLGSDVYVMRHQISAYCRRAWCRLRGDSASVTDPVRRASVRLDRP